MSGRRRGGSNKPEPPILAEDALPALRRHAPDRDPREAMGIGTVAEDAPRPVTGIVTRMDGALDSKRLVTKYSLNLVACMGDKVRALAATFNISEDEASRSMIALHDRIVAAQRVMTSASEMFEENDLGLPVRLARLREMMFSTNPAVALKAMDMANDLDATVKSKQIGARWEQTVANVRAKAERELKRKPKAENNE